MSIIAKSCRLWCAGSPVYTRRWRREPLEAAEKCRPRLAPALPANLEFCVPAIVFAASLEFWDSLWRTGAAYYV